jgi:hypothetical protein
MNDMVRPKWHRLYFALAGFDVLTIGISLFLSHQVITNYIHSVAHNQTWIQTLGIYDQLAKDAGRVDNPGNDLFGSHDVKKEAARFVFYTNSFKHTLRWALVDCQKKGYCSTAINHPGVLDPYFRAIQIGVTQVEKEAKQVFQEYEKANFQEAARHMSVMDQHYGHTLDNIEMLRSQLRNFQKERFEKQLQETSDLRQGNRVKNRLTG